MPKNFGKKAKISNYSFSFLSYQIEMENISLIFLCFIQIKNLIENFIICWFQTSWHGQYFLPLKIYLSYLRKIVCAQCFETSRVYVLYQIRTFIYALEFEFFSNFQQALNYFEIEFCEWKQDSSLFPGHRSLYMSRGARSFQYWLQLQFWF